MRLSVARFPLYGRYLGLYEALKKRFQVWLFQLRGPESGSILLVQRRIFILPSRHGGIFMGSLLVMLTGSINYSLSLGFVLTFLLAALGVNSILHTFRNLSKLLISAGRTHPVYAGGEANFAVLIDNPGTLERFSVGITLDGKRIVYSDVPAGRTTTVSVALTAMQRGWLSPGKLTLFTYYPLGLCYAWAYVHPDVRCLVYPRLETPAWPLPPPLSHHRLGVGQGLGEEDFAGLRAYHAGDSPRHIAWKAAARGQGLLTKQFSGSGDSELWLSWDATPENLGTEGRVSRLARWVVEAHAAGLTFGLRIPGHTFPPTSGEVQRDRCLEALALFQLRESPV